LNYKFCLEQNGNHLPFGVAQVGKSFRNEIAPARGLTRQREFTQAEIEYFVNPQRKEHPKFKEVADLNVMLFHSNEQLAAKEPTMVRMGDAVSQGLIDNQTLGYYMARTYMFLLSVGIRQEHLRFRQHLPTEMAHYAKDCWDAEIFTSYGWLESVGIADRSCFDLNAHAEATRSDLQFRETLEKPIECEVLAMTKQSGITVMKAFKKDGKMLKEWIDALPQEEICALDRDTTQNGSKEVEVDGRTFTILKEHLTFEKKIEKTTVRAFTPGVIEPSFGIDRIFFAVMEHTYFARPKEDNSEDKQIRGVLSFAANISPYKISILPLDQRISRDEQYLAKITKLRKELSKLALSYTIDEGSASIGKRYSRNDELGVPYATTFDFQTLEDDTVTLRVRDSMDQLRMPLSNLAVLIRDLTAGKTSWDATAAKYLGCHIRAAEDSLTNPA